MFNLLIISWPVAKHIKTMWYSVHMWALSIAAIAFFLCWVFAYLPDYVKRHKKWIESNKLRSGIANVFEGCSIICAALFLISLFNGASITSGKGRQIEAADNVGCYHEMREIKHEYPSITTHTKTNGKMTYDHVQAIRTYQADHHAYRHGPDMALLHHSHGRWYILHSTTTNISKSVHPKAPAWFRYI